MYRILHTSDWHLGQNFRDYDRAWEHQQFLNWLTELVAEKQIDLLLITGDIFDVANPSAAAQKMLYKFLKEVHCKNPNLQIIITAGNHDSGNRLEAPRPLLDEFNTSVIGSIQKRDDREIDTEKLIIPLAKNGHNIGYCCAVPFIRLGEYTLPDGSENNYNKGVESVYHSVINDAKRKLTENEILLVTGHLHMLKGEISEDSERNVAVGGISGVSPDLFPDYICYTALGHLHKPQKIEGKEQLQYSGSPLPMSFSEIKYKHRVVLIETDNGQRINTESILIPRFVDLIRIPENHETIDEVEKKLSEFTLPETEPQKQPYLEVRILLKEPEPGLKFRIEEKLKGKPVKLTRIDVKYQGKENSTEKNIKSFDELKKIDPQEIFAEIFEKKYGNKPEEKLTELLSKAIQHASIKLKDDEETN